MSETAYLISEAAKQAGVESHVLRYWEEELELPIARNKMGHRYYTKQDIQIFLAIKELKKRGFQLKMIRELIPKLEEETPLTETVTREKQKEIAKKEPLKEKLSKEVPVKKVKVQETKQEEVKSKETPPKVEKQPEVMAEAAVSRQVDKPAKEKKTVHNAAVKPKEETKQPKEQNKAAEKAQDSKKKNAPQVAKVQQIQKVPVRDIKKEQDVKKSKETHQEEFYQIMERLFQQLSKKDSSEDRYKRLDAAIRKHQYSRRMVAATEEQGKKRKKKYTKNK